MKRAFRHLLLTVTTISLLASCGRQESVSYSPTIAPLAVRWTVELLKGSDAFASIRSSALLGVYLSDFLMRQVMFRSAIAGIAIQMDLLNEGGEEQEESFALLETLGAILQVDVPDMLNRSTNRIDAFDTYLSNLQTIGERSTAHKEGLEQQMDTLMDERSDIRGDVARTQSQLNIALREQDYATASEQQKNLIEGRGNLAKIDARIDELRSIRNLFDDLLDIAEERVTVMTSNREALLAGITVVDVPGVEDYGLIEKRRRRSRQSIFDPGSF
jgi:hypothetical protein